MGLAEEPKSPRKRIRVHAVALAAEMLQKKKRRRSATEPNRKKLDSDDVVSRQRLPEKSSPLRFLRRLSLPALPPS